MLNSKSIELYEVKIPNFLGKITMLPFNLLNLEEIPDRFKELVKKMTQFLPLKEGIAYFTADGKMIQKGSTHRRGGPHIDGNYLDNLKWGGNGDQGWKVGEGGRILSTEEHKLSYMNKNGGMLIASTYPACKGWVGEFEGESYIGGDCSKINLNEGFILKPNKCYYGTSQFIHESLPINESIHRVLVRITLPINYPSLID